MKGIPGIQQERRVARHARLLADIQEVLPMERKKLEGGNLGDIGNLFRAPPLQCLRHPGVGEVKNGGQGKGPQGPRGSHPPWDRQRPGLVSVGAVFDQALANGKARRL